MEEARQHPPVGKSRRQAIDPGWDKGRRLTFSPAVRQGNLLFVSGVIGKVDDKGQIVSKGDIAAQAREAYEKIGIILKTAGCTFDDVLKTTDYITTLENYQATASVRREIFREPFPAATGVLVSGLVRKDALIEIEVIAAIPE